MTENEKLIEGSVWVIVYNYPYDSGHYSPSWEERIETEDHGFFRTEEAAQEFADQRNDYGSKYAKYVQGRQAVNRREQAAYDERKAKWDTLVASGLTPSDFMPEPRLTLSEIKTLEEMIPLFEREDYYSIQEVKPHA